MTSATTNRSKRGDSKASRDLQLALGQKRIALSELHPRELQALLKKELSGLDMKEFRGFKELKETLSRRGDELLKVGDSPSFVCHGSPEEPFTLKSHTPFQCVEVYSRKNRSIVSLKRVQKQKIGKSLMNGVAVAIFIGVKSRFF